MRALSKSTIVVEKAFREGTARQNAHSTFICLALGLLEERVHVACKEITMLEKQNKLLEEEEDEKREEKERKERKRLKDKEKKLRRKQKLKGKEQEKGKKSVESVPVATISQASTNVTILTAKEKQLCHSNAPDTQDMKDSSIFLRSLLPDMEEARPSMDGVIFENGNCQYHDMLSVDEMDGALGKRDGNGAFITEHSKSARRKAKLRKGPVLDMFSKRVSWRGPDMNTETNAHVRSFGQVPSNSFVENTFMPIHGLWKHSKNVSKSNKLSKTDYRGNPVKWNENSHWSTGRSNCRYDYQQCVCGSAQSNIKLKCRHERLRESRIAERHNTAINVSKPVYKIGNPINEPIPESPGVSKGTLQAGMVSWGREERVHPKRGWEHLESHQLHRDSVSMKRDSSDGTPPCVLGTVPDSLNRNGKMFDTCSNGGTGSNLSASSENEKDCSISHSDHIECNAMQCGLPSRCHVQQMNHVTIEQAVEGSLASNTVKPRSLTVAGSGARSTCSADADGFTFGPSSSKIPKKEDINSIAGLSSHGPQYGNHLIFGVQQETTQNVGYDLGNAQGTDNVRGTCKCESVSSPTLKGSEDMQLKGPLTGYLNAILLAPENSIFPTMEMTCQHQMPAFNISNLSSPFFPLHCQPNPVCYPVRKMWTPLSANGLLQCPQPNKALFSGSAGFGFLPSSLPALLMPYPCLQALPPVFGARHMTLFPIGPNCVQFNELTQFSSIGELHTVEVGSSIDATSLKQEIKHPHGQQDFNGISLSEGLSQQKTLSNLPAYDASAFSLFHFDSPSAVAIEQDSNTSLLKRGSMGGNHMISNGNCALQQHAAVMHKNQRPVEEYSLFAASHGNRFGFF